MCQNMSLGLTHSLSDCIDIVFAGFIAFLQSSMASLTNLLTYSGVPIGAPASLTPSVTMVKPSGISSFLGGWYSGGQQQFAFADVEFESALFPRECFYPWYDAARQELMLR